MTNLDRQSATAPHRDAAANTRRRVNLAAAHRGERWGDGRYLAAYRRLLARHRRLVRRVAIGSGVVVALFLSAVLGLWWRLSSGPIQLDAFTPWLVAAIEENFGSREHVEVGGTQFERTENGGAAVRLRDIVVRDPDGTVVASAPKAEVHVSGLSLLSGHMRAESLNLVGAEMAVRIEQNGEVTVFAGANKHPIATAIVPPSAPSSGGVMGWRQDRLSPAPAGRQAAPVLTRPGQALPPQASDSIAALLAWIDGIGESGLDGHELRELGLKNGTLTVDDRRTGKRWTFEDITLSLERPRGGGVVVTIGSNNPERSWGLTASIKPVRDGVRSVALEARRVSANDLLLATRFDDGTVQTNLPVSASLHGEIGSDGIPLTLAGRIVAEAGYIADSTDPDGRIELDRAEVKVNWDAANRLLAVPMQILSGGNRITLLGQIEAPSASPGPWGFKVGGGTVLLTSSGPANDPLILNRVTINGHFDPLKRQFVIDEGDLGNSDLGIALSGTADYSTGELHLTAGAAATRMSTDAMKRLWPVFVSTKVRTWFNEHLTSGTVERLTIAVNAPFNTLKTNGPLLPDDGLTLDALATNCVVRPVEGLPALHDADLTVHIVGRDAQISLGRATADLPSGRKLVLSSGVFEVPDTGPREPPARVHFKVDGPVPAAAELIALDRLRDASGVPFDPATTRGTMSAQVALGLPLKPDLPPGSTNYSIAVDATNFSAEHMIMGQRVDAAALKVTANNLGFALKGDVKIGGTPASLEYRKMRSDTEADVRIQGMLDETMRATLGLDQSNLISGSIPIQVAGRVATSSDRDGRFSVEADLTPAQIDGFLPGWAKQSGKPARATFTLTTKPQSVRIDDLLIEGAGGGVKGAIEFDGAGELQSATFPSYGFADGDRTSFKVDRMPDGALRVVMRGDAYDGRGFIKLLTGGPSGQPPSKRPVDLDLDMKLGAIVGFNGEALHSLDLKLSRRAGEIRSLAMNAKIGRNATLSGELRSQSGRQVIDLETNDAGALFRFTDVYTRMNGGQMAVAMDPPSASNTTQLGAMNVNNFSVHDETQLERAVANGNQMPQNNNLDFTTMRINFMRTPGRMALRDGVVRGPVLGGTIDGMLDYTRDEVHLRGTLIPLYGANNLLGQLPVVGLFLGGEKEGLLGVTYEVVGKPGTPVLHVNPLSALAPGLLRKVFEYPANGFPGNPPGNSMPDDNIPAADEDYTSGTYNGGPYNSRTYNSGSYNTGNSGGYNTGTSSSH